MARYDAKFETKTSTPRQRLGAAGHIPPPRGGEELPRPAATKKPRMLICPSGLRFFAHEDTLAHGPATRSGFLLSATNAMTSIDDPTTGVLATTDADYQTQLSNLSTQISNKQAQVNQLQTSLTNQMNSADALINSLEEQYTIMSDMLQAQRTTTRRTMLLEKPRGSKQRPEGEQSPCWRQSPASESWHGGASRGTVSQFGRFLKILPRRIAGHYREKDVRSGSCPRRSNAGNDWASRGYSAGAEEEHRNGPQAASTGDSDGTKDAGTRDGDQKQTTIAKSMIACAAFLARPRSGSRTLNLQQSTVRITLRMSPPPRSGIEARISRSYYELSPLT
jgi:hypothetical protein